MNGRDDFDDIIGRGGGGSKEHQAGKRASRKAIARGLSPRTAKRHYARAVSRYNQRSTQMTAGHKAAGRASAIAQARAASAKVKASAAKVTAKSKVKVAKIKAGADKAKAKSKVKVEKLKQRAARAKAAAPKARKASSRPTSSNASRLGQVVSATSGVRAGRALGDLLSGKAE